MYTPNEYILTYTIDKANIKLKYCILYSHILSFFQSPWEFDIQNGYNAIHGAIISEKDLIFYQSLFYYAEPNAYSLGTTLRPTDLHNSWNF